MKKIVLLGGSNSILSDGIPKAMKANKDINFYKSCFGWICFFAKCL